MQNQPSLRLIQAQAIHTNYTFQNNNSSFSLPPSPFLAVFLHGGHDGLDGVFDEVAVDALVGRENAARVSFIAEVVVGEEAEDDGGQRIHAPLTAVGRHCNCRQYVLQRERNLI